MNGSFLSPEPEVVLVKSFSSAYQNFIATARTCYSSKGIIDDQQIDDRWDALAQGLYQAGHHTTLQHAHFQFSLNQVSRHFVWSFLHSHPFYNSEQVSQRYVSVKPGTVVVPNLFGEAQTIYENTTNIMFEAYHRLCEKLLPLVTREYGKRFPGRSPQEKRAKSDIQKKAQEIARYVLPVSTFTYMYHTISGVTLLRYYRLCKTYDVPHEQMVVVKKMVDALLAQEPKFRIILEEPLDVQHLPEHHLFDHVHGGDSRLTRAFIDEFDESLQGNVSQLIDYKNGNESVLAASVREVLGVPKETLSEQDAIELVLNPAKNTLLGQSLNVTTLSKLSRCMVHASYTFRKKLSHSADSQDQRHRMTPASRPILAGHLFDEPDFIVPELIRHDDAILKDYSDCMNQVWDAMNTLRGMGIQEQYVQYLLPNAVSIRFTESADLLNLRHKLAMRLCYNAQEEIWRASVDESKQVLDVNPTIGKYLLPPCTLRSLAKEKPVCPEGQRYCGERVWTYNIEDYQRMI